MPRSPSLYRSHNARRERESLRAYACCIVSPATRYCARGRRVAHNARLRASAAVIRGRRRIAACARKRFRRCIGGICVYIYRSMVIVLYIYVACGIEYACLRSRVGKDIFCECIYICMKISRAAVGLRFFSSGVLCVFRCGDDQIGNC